MISTADLPSDNFLIDVIPFQVEVVDSSKINGGMGEWDPANARLSVSPEQTLPSLVDTVMHEVLHGLVRARCPHVMEKEVEEQVVTGLTAGILQIIRDNPDWIDWMYEILNGRSRRDPYKC